jgi:hypothetical protein
MVTLQPSHNLASFLTRASPHTSAALAQQDLERYKATMYDTNEFGSVAEGGSPGQGGMERGILSGSASGASDGISDSVRHHSLHSIV